MINTKDIIGRRKYNELKRYDFDKMSTEEMVFFRKEFKISVADAIKKIENYENHHKSTTKEQDYQMKEYNRRVFKVASGEKKEQPILEKDEFKKKLYNYFQKEFFKLNGHKYIVDGFYLENLKPIMYYFLGDLESFKNCKNVFKSDKCVPNLKKGLLLIGDFGNGKTSTMEAFSKTCRGTKKYFNIIGSKEAVTKYSQLKDDAYLQKEFYNKLVSKNYLFDDMLKEGMASSYGNLNLIEQVLEERYRRKKTTHATINYKENQNGVIVDLNLAIQQIGEKYGGYLYDRTFSMFNIIEFKGKSLRGVDFTK